MLDFENTYDVLDIEKKIEEFKEKFHKIDECEFHFYASGYEDYDGYDYWGDNWVWEYYDEDNLGGLIESAYLYAMNSAPWYTSILVYGIFTLVVILVVIIVKILIKRYMTKH